MIRMIKIAMLALVALGFVACGDSNKSPEKVYSIGELISSGDYELQVTEVTSSRVVGSEFINSKASEGGIYVVVNYTIKNISNKPLGAFDLPDPKLNDPAGNKYDPDIGATASYASVADLDQKVFSDLNPGISTKGAKVFEVASERFNDGWTIKFDKVIVGLKMKPSAKTDPQSVSAKEAAPAKAEDPLDACFEAHLAEYKKANGKEPSEDDAKWMWKDCTNKLEPEQAQ